MMAIKEHIKTKLEILEGLRTLNKNESLFFQLGYKSVTINIKIKACQEMQQKCRM